MEFDVPTGTTDGDINVTISLDADCLETATVTLYVTNANGCTDTIGVPLVDPCDNFSSTAISVNNYTLSANAANSGCSQVTFTWQYNTAVFEVESLVETNFASTLKLKIRSGLNSYPNTAEASLTIEDCYGCSAQYSATIEICKAVAQDFTTTLFCAGSNFYSSTITFPDPTGCSLEFDWTTLQLNLPTGFSFVGTAPTGYFAATSAVLPGIYQGFYTVKDTSGVKSTQGTFALVVLCESETTTAIPDKVITLDCDTIPDEEVEINIENEIVTIGTIDWTTLKFTEPPTPLGSVVFGTNTDGDHIITYTVPDPVATDAFAWTVCDTDGFCARASVYTIIICPNQPTAVDDDLCAVCNETIVLNVLDNDTTDGAPLDLTSIVITTPPTKGTVLVPGDGTVLYTPNAGQTGADSFFYTVDSVNGSTSNAAEVTIDIVCAGTSINVTVCQ